MLINTRLIKINKRYKICISININRNFSKYVREHKDIKEKERKEKVSNIFD